MKTKIYLLLAILAFCSVGLNAQKGKLIGIVKDSDNNEPLAFATVFVNEVNKGASTDFDGKYAPQKKIDLKRVAIRVGGL